MVIRWKEGGLIEKSDDSQKKVSVEETVSFVFLSFDDDYVSRCDKCHHKPPTFNYLFIFLIQSNSDDS